MLKVLSQAVLDLLTWQELERRVCGDPELTVEALKKCSKYDHKKTIIADEDATYEIVKRKPACGDWNPALCDTDAAH